MLSDIADASVAAQRLGAERWEQLLRDHHTLVEHVVAHHDGQLVRFERDGFFASFNSAHAGLHAAVELQRTFAGPAEEDDHALAVRIGLHSGFVIANPDQPLGRNVVLASRVAAQAKGGEILVSSALKQYTEAGSELPLRAPRRAPLQGGRGRARRLRGPLGLAPTGMWARQPL